MLKRFPSLNTLALPIVSATTDGMTKAVIDFSRPAYTLLQQIGSTDIVPAYIWQGVKDPSKFADTDPVGTGPYMLQRFSTAGIWVVRNPHYWQPNNSGIERIYAAAYTSGTAAQLALETGQDQWAGLFVPNYQKLYVAKAPKYNVFWSPATGTVSLEPNNTIYPLNIPLVRKALAFAINRASVGNIGESGTELPVTSAVGLPMPTFKSYVAANYAGKNYSYDPSEAVKLLEKAGLRRNSKGVFLGKNGAPITLSIVDPSGYTDYMADAEIIAKELDNIGLHTSVDGVSVALWTTDYIDGKFDMTIRWSRGGGTPFFIYQGWLDGTETAPVGKAATGDYERFHSAAATGLLAEYGSTDNAAKQASLMAKLEGIVANAVPVVPLVGAANWDQHSTKEFVGWPTPTNPYILPSPDMPDMEVTILHLRPRG
jgi:peptide/nickel transport system substrate-binding protein